MVLGSMVAGPALLIFGCVLGAKASQKLSEAQENMEKARTFEVEVNGVCQKLDMIREVTGTAVVVLSSLRARLSKATKALKNVIDEYGDDFSVYNDEAKAVVFQNVKYAQLVKAVIDTPILNKNGELLGDPSKAFTEIKSMIN